ncbi:valine--tRNA ligase [Tepiditoga spiralis]|uniref:Valine--tRNA ligase n=2 Tax=Tepiditoga spiralis TaxID=2108365 RepID=A0A7G1GAH2_9BACT|nr:valine--tRNA ligase [Tepiditoga spiralis]BBE30479.1 valine--tRNA ligase [Tepiditoga spiralis]
MDIGNRYTPHELEKKWYSTWNEKETFKPKEGNDTFSIVIPPPNITGKLHVGHALNMTLQDVLTRYNRMKGLSTLWLPGEDHAGIATQHVVEKFLRESEGKRREEYGREEFVDRVWDWANEYKDHIRGQIKAMGASVDWSRERFTLDEGLNKAVRKVFVELYNEGLIYKGKYIVNWCPSCGTVLADDEVEHEDENGKFYHIKYYFENSDEYVIIATTRPETMLGDVAVAVHPSDERYKDIVGKNLILPLVNKKIPIISDPYVDPKFGTGMVKITPAHDPNDYQVGLRHNLERIQVMDESAKMTEDCGKYAGMDRYEARKEIVKDLEELNLLEKIEDHKHAVGHCYRCHTTVEPFLMDQWFVKMEPLAKKAIEAVEKEEIKFHPPRWKKVYLNWMSEIRDWCISRQLWWGHRIPVWYCEDCGHINVSENEVHKCEKCGSTNLKQDEDVLDTWFSSALWPFSTLGWPENTKDLEKFYPTSTLVTGFDIIFFWVARMIIMGEKFMNDKPFSDVYITPLVRDKQGRKMSKSLGNGLDPLEVIEKYGTDPMRFTLSILAAQGKDIKLDIKAFEPYSKFANKIWNATRFVLLNMNDFEEIELKDEMLAIEDKWIFTKLSKAVKEVSKAIEEYNFNIGAKTMYEFFWNEFCDWYIESVKDRLKDDNSKRVAQNVLVKVLDNALKLLHPFMPYITEELWQSLPIEHSSEMIITSSWPIFEKSYEIEESNFEKIMQVVRGIRNVKTEMNIAIIKKVEVKFKATNDNFMKKSDSMIKKLGFVSNIEKVSDKPNGTATAYVDDDMEVYVVVGDLIDIEAESARLEKKIGKLNKEVQKFEKKLSNKNFVEKASADVVEETKEKLNDAKVQLEKVEKLYGELK